MLAAPFLGSLHEVHAAAVAPPKRLVIFYTHNGCITDKWWPALEDGKLAADTFKGTSLEVLGSFYKKLLMPRGFRSMNEYGMGQSIDPHDQANGSKLTCAPIDSNNKRYATAESLDHTIAKQINPGHGAPLVLSVGPASTSIKDVISFSGPGMAFGAVTNPMTAYSSLTQAHPLGAAPAAPASTFRTIRRQSVLDVVRGDLKRLQSVKMSQADQRRLQDWQDLLRTTETGMGGAGGGDTAAGSAAACNEQVATKFGVTSDALTAASTPIASSVTDPTGMATAFTKGGDMMMNLMALHMMCDTNRVMMLTYPGYVTFNWDGIMATSDHSGLSHRTGDFSVGGKCVDGVIATLLQIDRWYAGKFARLVGLLDSIGEGNGTLLDNTATMWLPELSDGAAHNLNNLPIIIAGGAGGYLKQGAAVNVEGAPIGLGTSSQSCPPGGGAVRPSGSSGGNVPINKLYVTLMNAVGCTADGTPSGGKVATFGQFDGLKIDSGITNPGEVAALTSVG